VIVETGVGVAGVVDPLSTSKNNPPIIAAIIKAAAPIRATMIFVLDELSGWWLVLAWLVSFLGILYSFYRNRPFRLMLLFIII